MCLTKAAPRRAGRHDLGDVDWSAMARVDDQQVSEAASTRSPAILLGGLLSGALLVVPTGCLSCGAPHGFVCSCDPALALVTRSPRDNYAGVRAVRADHGADVAFRGSLGCGGRRSRGGGGSRPERQAAGLLGWRCARWAREQ